MRFYDPFEAAPVARKPAVPKAPRAALNLVRDEATGELCLPSFDKAAAVADVARTVPSGRRQRLDAKSADRFDLTIEPLDAEVWDFGLDPMYWARVRYARWQSTETLFASATPYEAPFKGAGSLLSQLFGPPTRAA